MGREVFVELYGVDADFVTGRTGFDACSDAVVIRTCIRMYCRQQGLGNNLMTETGPKDLDMRVLREHFNDERLQFRDPGILSPFVCRGRGAGD